jgi:hypothetical protein
MSEEEDEFKNDLVYDPSVFSRPLQVHPNPATHPNLFPKDTTPPILSSTVFKKNRAKKSRAPAASRRRKEPKGDDLAATTLEDEMESEGTENSEDRAFIDNSRDIDDLFGGDDDDDDAPIKRRSSGGSRRKSPQPRNAGNKPSRKQKKAASKKSSKRSKRADHDSDMDSDDTQGKLHSMLDMISQISKSDASASTSDSGAHAPLQQSTLKPAAVAVPKVSIHADLLQKEEMVKRVTSMIDVKEVKPRLYHGAVASLLTHKEELPNFYDQNREAINKAKELAEAGANCTDDPDDVQALVNKTLCEREIAELIPPFTRKDLESRMTLCKLCGWMENDADKRDARMSARLAKEDSMHMVKNQKRSGGVDDYTLSRMVDLIAGQLSRMNPDDICTLAAAFYYNEIWMVDQTLPELTAHDIYEHFWGRPCTLDPRFLAAKMIRDNLDIHEMLKRTMVVKNSLTNDEYVNDKAVRAFVVITKNIEGLLKWKCPEMNFFSPQLKANNSSSNVLIAPSACVVATTKKQFVLRTAGGH